MKPKTTGFAAWIVLALVSPVVSGPAIAETKAEMYQRCITKAADIDSSAECLALRANSETLQKECMVSSAATLAQRATNGVSLSFNSHGYKAHYILCTHVVSEKLMN